MNQSAGSETIAAIATPSGTGALGILRLTGPMARRTGESFLAPLRAGGFRPREAFAARASFQGEPVDIVMATYFPGPRTPTGEDLLEVTAHGSTFILGKLLEASLDAGARLARPGEFTMRAFLNGKLDLAQAEAVCDLIRARTGRGHRAALEQLEGGLSREVKEIAGDILSVLVGIEATLDHPEEDIPRLEGPAVALAIAEAGRPVLRLIESFRRGRLLTEGARVCIVGRPNAGKSSLLNALLGTDRAIVCASPGTTRDTIEEPCDLGGIPAVLVDTAGLREQPGDEAEALGLERSERALDRADLALLVIDGSRPIDGEDERILRGTMERARRAGVPLLTIRNKSDLPCLAESFACDAAVSARDHAGLATLVDKAARKLTDGCDENDGALVTSLRHQGSLGACASELSAAAASIEEHPEAWEELAACRLRHALKSLGEITGETLDEKVLAGVFSKFCVGK
ncbi:MAG: tRNA uridine-5-carboxymethylaminomethyl(34) synthesis GTPase MnmE [Elusimicrobia bacterium]|nr:tRNA uridine-5-carboxymethylaminomethyl(34) synthesis GTPase MnmE [Elusimicrobiota bacterium]